MADFHKVLNGKGIMIKDDDIVDAVHYFPNMSKATYKKLESAYKKGKASRLKLSASELSGHGLGQQVARSVKKVGRATMNSGIGDFVIDEAVGLLPMPSIAQRAVSAVARKEAHQLTGTGINNYNNNPYIPKILRGSGLQNYGIPISTHNNSSNIVPIDSDAFHPTAQMSNAYSNPINHSHR
jgi:hypothetical protein